MYLTEKNCHSLVKLYIICFSDIEPTNFANVEDMLFEVFRCEETDTINNIAIAHFLKVWFVQAT